MSGRSPSWPVQLDTHSTHVQSPVAEDIADVMGILDWNRIDAAIDDLGRPGLRSLISSSADGT